MIALNLILALLAVAALATVARIGFFAGSEPVEQRRPALLDELRAEPPEREAA